MDGLGLRGLLSHYVRLHTTRGLGLLCVQENLHTPVGAHTHAIARELGTSFAHLGDSHSRMGMVYDRDRLELIDHALVPLPKLERLTWFQRLYISGGKPSQKYAQLAVFRPEHGEPIPVFNFHLETAGTHEHRNRQVAAIAQAAIAQDHHERLVACGDTNAFELATGGQPAALAAILEPLEQLGARDPGTTPTHFFARQHEPKPLHRIAVLLGRIGIDVPQRYDVVCTNIDVVARGQLSTIESDHDLVWAQLVA